MKNAQFTFDDFVGMLRRRKVQFFVPAIIIICLCTVGAFLLPKKYESSMTILVQGDQVLNPLVSYQMGIAMANNDPLRDFDQIIYSRPVIEDLIDSLNMGPKNPTLAQTEALIKTISSSIKTGEPSSNTLSISFDDTSPERAKRAVSVLSELYIHAKLGVENKKNEFAVQFFSQKLNELRDKFEQSQQDLVSAMKQHSNQSPESDRTLYTQIDDYNGKVSAIQDKINNYQQALSIIKQQDSNAGSGKLDMKALYQLPLLDVPYATDLQNAVSKYETLSAKYTPQYPDVQDARANAMALMARVKTAIESELGMYQSQLWQLEKERDESINTVNEAAVSQNQNQDVKSDFDIYKELYNEMKIKLQQAQTSLDLGENGAQEYVVLDPPQVPTTPAKPNKPLIIGGGFSLAIFIGLLSAGLSELLDTRIRRPEDIEIYDKPIIAYLPAAPSNRSSQGGRKAY